MVCVALSERPDAMTSLSIVLHTLRVHTLRLPLLRVHSLERGYPRPLAEGLTLKVKTLIQQRNHGPDAGLRHTTPIIASDRKRALARHCLQGKTLLNRIEASVRDYLVDNSARQWPCLPVHGGLPEVSNYPRNVISPVREIVNHVC